MSDLTVKVQPPHYNAFSHENKKFGQLAIDKTSRFKLATQFGMPPPNVELKCKHIKFADFVQLLFADDVPQFINTLFKFLASADLRYLLKPAATKNKFSSHLRDKMERKKEDALKRRCGFDQDKINYRMLRPNFD